MEKRILIAPLNWGLGHATRCIPIIHTLIQHHFTPVIASDGAALLLLSKEFPNLETLELPSYPIRYSKKGYFLRFQLLIDSPKLLKTIRAEHLAIKDIVKKHDIQGIISDNRFGVYHQDLPSVIITHQLRVLSGHTTWLSTKIHQKIIKKFDACWIPDVIGPTNLSGKLGHIAQKLPNTHYIGPLSRFKKTVSEPRYDVMIVLSGPEPQRTLLEKKLFAEFENYQGDVLFIKGLVESEQSHQKIKNITVYNFMTSDELEIAFNQSQLILSRSGYTTVMDLSTLEKKAFFIPTPGQFEQEYLAKKLNDENVVPSCNQKEFTIKKLEGIEGFKGLKAIHQETDFKTLFSLFKGK